MMVTSSGIQEGKAKTTILGFRLDGWFLAMFQLRQTGYYIILRIRPVLPAARRGFPAQQCRRFPLQESSPRF